MPFTPQQIANGLYKAESYTADGEMIDLYMELPTNSGVAAWNSYRKQAVSIVTELQKNCVPHNLGILL